VKIKRRSGSPIGKAARKGFRGYPVATVAFYGPDDQRASKVAVGIVMSEDAEPEILERWFSDSTDIRYDLAIASEIHAFITSNGAKTVVATGQINGCPHEEGVDYPDGQVCPECPFWANVDRWTHERLSSS
jgi:hypothetical protein